MNLEEHPAGENIQYLRQGIDLIRQLDGESYTRSSGKPFRGGVGSQFRHCIDFYHCLLGGLDGGRIDYTRRERDAEVELDRDHAVRRAEALIGKLAGLIPSQLEQPLQIRSDVSAAGLPTWSGSTLHRELQFLVSHTIHHYALIVALLREQGFDVATRCAEFGVAPSTLRHWQEIDSLGT